MPVDAPDHETADCVVASIVTPHAPRRLLEWLDDGIESHGWRYVEMRRRLVGYFDRRNRVAAGALADETLRRVGQALESGVIESTPPARYCYLIATRVLDDDIRGEQPARCARGRVALPAAPPAPGAESGLRLQACTS